MRILGIIFIIACAIFLQIFFDKQKQNAFLTNTQISKQNAKISPKNEQNLSIYRILYAKPVSEWLRPNIDESVEWQELAPLPQPNFPNDNDYSDIKAYLGLLLFNEPKLSKSGQIACQSCHNDELSHSYGHDRKRSAPNIQMSAFFETLFLDTRSLEEQFLGSLSDLNEMANTPQNAVASIKMLENYYPLFVAAFGNDEEIEVWQRYFPQIFSDGDKDRLSAFLINEIKIDTKILDKFPSSEIAYAQDLITIENIAKAVATYQRTFARAKNSRFNMFLKGEYGYLSDLELYGLDVFRHKGQCMNCHWGAILSDNKFHNLELSFYGRKSQDYSLAQSATNAGKFKTLSLINVSKSAPYMQNGIFTHLRGTTKHNADFSNAEPNTLKDDPLIRELNLTAEEISALEAFLRTL